MFDAATTPVVILTEGHLGQSVSKLATGVLRYGRWPVVAVVDSAHAGKTVADVIPSMAALPNGRVPVVGSLDDLATFSIQPRALILGTAPIGGSLPESWRAILKAAIETHGLHLINGLHDFLSRDAELAALAARAGVTLWDVRDPDQYEQGWWPISRHLPRPPHVRVVTMVGSDCSVGKMFSALALTQAFQDRGHRAHFVATGQVGIVISGQGVPLDRCIGDFMAGSMESVVHQAIAQYDDRTPLWVIVEGQGSLLHPAYSGVTLSLVHGSRPDAMVLCHNPAITHVKGGYHTPVPSLTTLIDTYETAAAWINGYAEASPLYPRARVLGVSLNTAALDEAAAHQAIAAAARETGLPASDPVRVGMDALVDGLLATMGTEDRCN